MPFASVRAIAAGLVGHGVERPQFRRHLNIQSRHLVEAMNVDAPDDLDAVFDKLARQPAGALFVLSDSSLLGLTEPIVARALALRVPAFGNFAELFAQAGGLYAYSRDPKEAYQGVARILKKILAGTIPADIPFEQPTKFNLFVNLKTAKALGITMPPSLLLLADEVIQ